MIQRISKRFLSLLLVAVMVLALVPAITLPAFAATSGTVTGLADENIGLSYSGDADDAWSANGTSITGAATSTGGTCSDTSHKSTLTITNKKSTTATLSFDYAIEQNSGTIQVDRTKVTAGSKFSKELAPNASIKVYIESGSTSAATKITMTNVVLVSNANATATFVPAENGTYTVDGKRITEEYSNTQSSMTAYKVVATPADGYQFLGWYNLTTGKCIATAATTALNIESDCTVTAKFVSKSLALFETGGQRFADLNEAVAYAQANKQSKITLATDGSISGTYTIPAGITLLIPLDAAGTLYTDAPAAIRTDPASKPFRTLTMAEGTSITVNGAISLGGRYYAAGGGAQGRPVGDYGYIKMADNSSITVKNGGNLYAWGFISGSGSILAESGATVYEFYQIADFRGGSASSNMSNKVFPFSQYFVQNIEVPLTLNAGANEKVFSGVYAMSTTYTTSINFIGDTGMFKVVSGSFTKDYAEQTDRLIFTVNGEAVLNTLALKLAGMSVNSANYVLPITNNITINIQSGNVTINQDTALLAGVEVNISEGAGLTVANGKNIYVYDSDEWNSDNFVWGPCKFKSVAYAPGKAYNRTNADLKDAKVDVNGNLTAIGTIYTTNGGADICSSGGTGKYIQQGTPGTETVTYQYNANGNNAVNIPITPAKLHNADGSYTETANAAAGDTIDYVNGVWGGEPAATEYTVTFDANGGEGSMDAQTVPASTDTTLTSNTFTRTGYTFTGWNTDKDGNGTHYDNGATVNLTEDLTLYAQWQINTYTVTWVDEDGTELETDENVPYGTTPEYNGETPTKTGDAQYTYTFTGWDPAVSAVTGDVTYKAIYTQTVNQYTITWKNWDGTELKTEQVAYGEVPAYTGETPTREGDAEHTYTFSGWTPEIQTVTGEAEYTAVFTDTINTYTVTWKNWDGTVLETDENVEYGTTPEYNGATPTKTGDAQYSYTFKGWSPAVDTVTGDITYTAVFEETVNQYTITWKNWDDTVLKTEQVSYGTTPVYSGDTPAKEGDAQYSYAFTGWTPEITAVTGNAEYTAQFQESVNTYTVTWQDANGTVLETDENVAYGTVPTYDGETPTKAADAQYTYAFKGWNPEITAVTSDVTYTAVFDETHKDGWFGENSNFYYYLDGQSVTGMVRVPYPAADLLPGYGPDAEDAEVNVPGKEGNPDNYDYPDRESALFVFDENGVFQKDQRGVYNDNGVTRWINNGMLVWHAGLVKDGDDYRYFKRNGMVTSIETYVAKTNDLLKAAKYTFDAEGRLMKLEGLHEDLNGNLCYYVDYVKNYAGLVEVDGSFYYIASDLKAVKNCTYYVTKTNDLKPAGYYTFDADGKMVIKSGLVEENGDLYYYVDGAKTAAGLIEWEGNYYYIASNLKAVKGARHYVFADKANGLKTAGWYWFNADGTMFLEGIREENGTKYYYKDGVKNYAGLIEISGEYYYVKSDCSVVCGRSYYVTKSNGLMPSATYTFDADGKMVIKNGIYREKLGDGNEYLFYYVNNVRQVGTGLVQLDDGSYIYVRSGANLAVGSYYVSKTNDLLPKGTYTFGEDGKMVVNP